MKSSLLGKGNLAALPPLFFPQSRWDGSPGDAAPAAWPAISHPRVLGFAACRLYLGSWPGPLSPGALVQSPPTCTIWLPLLAVAPPRSAPRLPGAAALCPGVLSAVLLSVGCYFLRGWSSRAGVLQVGLVCVCPAQRLVESRNERNALTTAACWVFPPERLLTP